MRKSNIRPPRPPKPKREQRKQSEDFSNVVTQTPAPLSVDDLQRFASASQLMVMRACEVIGEALALGRRLHDLEQREPNAELFEYDMAAVCEDYCDTILEYAEASYAGKKRGWNYRQSPDKEKE